MTDIREKTILIIDDEEVIRQSFSDYLEDLDFRTLTAENGRVGIEIFDRQMIDLVLVDLRMPEMNGIEVMAHIRKKNPDTPLIVVSGTGVIADAVAALHQGAWDYLLKPIKDLSVLAHAVDMALEKARLKLENRRYQQHLEQMVADRTKALEEANKHLRTSERNLSSMMANTLDGVIKIDKHFRHIFANAAIYDAVGLSPDQYLGKTNEDINAPADLASSLRTKYEKVFTTGKTEIFEICYPTVNKGERIFQAVVVPEFDENNEVETIVNFMRDITNLKQAEQALRESEKRYRSVIEISPLGIGITDTEGVIVNANQALASMLGYEISELMGLNFKDISHPDDLQRQNELNKSLINNEETSFCLEKRYRHKNGNYFWINLTVAKMLDLAGDEVLIFGFIEDISNRKKMELEREKLINELQDALAEIKELRGIFPICSNCKKIRDDAGYWQQVETYIEGRTDAKFSHSICPDCAKKLYPDFYQKILGKKRPKS